MASKPAISSNSAVPDNLDEMERSVLVHNVLKDDNSDEDGGVHTRLEFDSDFSFDEEEDEVQIAAVVENNTTDWASVLTTHRPKNNTGGKGVLADYKEATRIQRRRNETERLAQLEALKRAGGARDNDPSLSLASQLLREQQQKTREQRYEDEDSDEEVIKSLRAVRVGQLASVSNLPKYGRLVQVGKFEFVDAVDQCDPRTHVIVHLYEDYLSACRRMNSILSVLADRYPHVYFLKLLATEADQTLSHRTLPAFLVYKGGKRCGNASVNAVKTEFHNELFTEDDVEWFLASKYAVPLRWFLIFFFLFL